MKQAAAAAPSPRQIACVMRSSNLRNWADSFSICRLLWMIAAASEAGERLRRRMARSGGEQLLQIVDKGLHAIGFAAHEHRVAGAVEDINDIAVGHVIVSARVRRSQAVADAVAPCQLLQLLWVAAQAHELGA